MRSEPLPVSVVIPAYRRPQMVERALRSVLAQEPRPAEVLVVDDGSGDDTGARAAALGARVITHEHNQGEGAARNTGLAAAEHVWVALLDCDDEWLPGHLATLWAARNGHVVVGTAALGTGQRPQDHRIYGWTGRRPRVLRGPADVALPENKLVPSAVLIRREEVLAAGGFRRDLPRAADLELWVRLLEHGSALALPQVTSLYHVHEGQVSLDAAPMWAAHRAVLERHAQRDWHTPAMRRRHEGVIAWDESRAALARREPWPGVILRLLLRVVVPQRCVGLVQLLAGRHRGRRRASRFSPGGSPSVALLAGTASGEPAGDEVDLRRLPIWLGLLRLLWRPTACAVAPAHTRLPLRAIGITPLPAEARR